MPIFFPISPFNMLYFLLQKSIDETANRGFGRIISVQRSQWAGNRAGVFGLLADLAVLVRILVNERRTTNCKPFQLGWQGHGTDHMGAGALGRLDDPLGGLVENAVVISLKTDADLLFSHVICCL